MNVQEKDYQDAVKILLKVEDPTGILGPPQDFYTSRVIPRIVFMFALAPRQDVLSVEFSTALRELLTYIEENNAERNRA